MGQEWGRRGLGVPTARQKGFPREEGSWRPGGSRHLQFCCTGMLMAHGVTPPMCPQPQTHKWEGNRGIAPPARGFGGWEGPGSLLGSNKEGWGGGRGADGGRAEMPKGLPTSSRSRVACGTVPIVPSVPSVPSVTLDIAAICWQDPILLRS